MIKFREGEQVKILSCLLSDMTDLSGSVGEVVGKKREGGLTFYLVNVEDATGRLRSPYIMPDYLQRA